MIIIILLLVLLHGYLIYVNKPVVISEYEKLLLTKEDILVCHLSDVHLTTYNKHLQKMVEDIRNLKPDYIFFSGDLIDRRKPNEEQCLQFLNDLQEIAPVYFVNGNHEMLYKNPSFLNDIKATNVHYLNNEVESLNERVNIIGLNDIFIVGEKNKEGQQQFIKDNLNKLVDNNKTNLLLIHQPQYFELVAQYKIDYVFSGHTHGGLVRLPLIGGIFAPGQSLLPKYDAGWFEENNTHIIISRGIGSAFFPLRGFNKPEMIVIRFNKKEG